MGTKFYLGSISSGALSSEALAGKDLCCFFMPGCRNTANFGTDMTAWGKHEAVKKEINQMAW